MIKKGWLMRRLSIPEPRARLLAKNRTTDALAELRAIDSSCLRVEPVISSRQCEGNKGLTFD